jgi:hypothetical protein
VARRACANCVLARELLPAVNIRTWAKQYRSEVKDCLTIEPRPSGAHPRPRRVRDVNRSSKARAIRESIADSGEHYSTPARRRLHQEADPHAAGNSRQKIETVSDATRRLRGRRVSNGYEKHAITARATSELNPGANVTRSAPAVTAPTTAAAILSIIIITISFENVGKANAGLEMYCPGGGPFQTGPAIPRSLARAMPVMCEAVHTLEPIGAAVGDTRWKAEAVTGSELIRCNLHYRTKT